MKGDMQLVLVQTEVEQAIKDYVGRLINIAPGTQMDIDLSATRGTEGIKAIIELSPMKPTTGDNPAGEPAATTTVRRGRPPKPKSEDTPAEASAEVEKLAEPEQEATQEPKETASETTDEVESTDESTEAAEEAPAPPAAPAEKPRSLFANLRKPQNS